MRFRFDAPGLLVPLVEGGYAARWTASPTNFGYSQAAVEAQVSTALNDSRGWEQLGINFVNTGPDDSGYTVTYQVVETITIVDPNAWGVSIPGGYYTGFPVPTIQIEAAHFADLGIPNHEAAHAFFGASHSPEGSDSLMEPMEDPGSEWPSPTDLLQVAKWLATAPNPSPAGETDGATEGGRFWFPGNLPYYVTRYPVEAGSEARLTATVLKSTRGVLQALCHEDYDELMADNGRRLAAGIDLYHEGLFASPWQECPTGELYVGILADVETNDILTDLVVGLAEVQIRSVS